MLKLHILWTDALIYLLVLVVMAYAIWASRREHLKAPWRKVFKNRLGVASFIILSIFISIGLLDSVHFREALPGNGESGEVHYSATLKSAFDFLISPLGSNYEKTYSKPFASTSFVKEMIELPDGQEIRDHAPLKYTVSPDTNQKVDILKRILIAFIKAILTTLFLVAAFVSLKAARAKKKPLQQFKSMLLSDGTPWRLIFIMLGSIIFVLFTIIQLQHGYHIFGTDKVGQDILYQTLKSIRTGLVIGTLTTLVMLPFAVLLGIMAGYFGGVVDDVIQYLYTTLSSIPGVLLIAAAILSMQVFISNHPDMFKSLADQADIRLLSLCIILGITSWTGLCRILRGETLKLREIDYIQAAVALGVGRFKIILRHILPNVIHIILITVVLDFSGLVLAEAVLTYVGVGVDPTTISWGNMINSARLELAREPVVWWPLTAAFVFMFLMVLSANLFSDAVRDAFDPRGG